MRQLDEAERRALLSVARRAIEAAICRDPIPPADPAGLPAGLAEPAAAFVTLHEAGDVRGCIGELRFELPVWINVHDAAIAAALDDPRFPPLGLDELPLVDLEVSVLQPPVEIADASGFEAGRHGIIVERGYRRALLLPQVATEWGWGASEMLEAVCRKAGLSRDAWRDRDTRLFVFEAQYFGELDSIEAEPADVPEAVPAVVGSESPGARR